MRHRRGDLDQRFHAAERLRQREQFRGLHQPDRRLVSALDEERDHPAAVFHLTSGELILRMAFVVRVIHLLHFRMRRQEVRDCRRVFRVTFHPQGERLDPAQDEERVHRSQYGADRVLQEVESLGQFLVLDDDRAADHVRVTAEVFRHRVDDDVRAQFERTLEVGRGEGVVHRQQRTVRVRVDDLRHGADVGDAHQRVGRRLEPDQPRGRGQRVGDRFRVGRVGKRKVEREAAQHFVEETEGPAVHVVPRQDVRARVEQAEDGVGGGQSRGEGQPEVPALERGKTILQGFARGIHRARIFISLARPADAVLLVSGREVDGRHHRAVVGVGLLPCMDG